MTRYLGDGNDRPTNSGQRPVNGAPREEDHGSLLLHDDGNERRILIVDDFPLVATGLQLALSARGWLAEVTDTTRADEVIAHAERFGPACILLDRILDPGLDEGLDVIARLVATGARLVMLADQCGSPALAAGIEAGAVGWVRRDAYIDDLVVVLERALAGGPTVGVTLREAMVAELRAERRERARSAGRFDELTDREARVLAALMEGLSADEIAEGHFVAVSTVRSQIRAILGKLEVRSQLAAVAAAHRAGWSRELQLTGHSRTA